MRRFTLNVGKWYACEIIGDFLDSAHSEDRCSYTPIKILGIESLGKGSREFLIRFYHVNYPEGVQGKEYRIQTIERGQSFILANSLDHDLVRFRQIYDITAEWVRSHFPQKDSEIRDIYGWLERNT